LISSLANDDEEGRKSSKRRVIRRRKVKAANIIDDRGSDLSCLVDYEDPPEEPAQPDNSAKVFIINASVNKISADNEEDNFKSPVI